MKPLILVVVCLLFPIITYADSAIVGTQWKQVGSELTPADDITVVNFTGYSTEGVAGGISEGSDAGFGNLTGTRLDFTTAAIANISSTFINTSTISVNYGADGIQFGNSSNSEISSSGSANLTLTSGGATWFMNNGVLSGGISGSPSMTNNPSTCTYGFGGDGDTCIDWRSANTYAEVAGGVDVQVYANDTTTFFPSGAGQVKIDASGNVVIGGSLSYTSDAGFLEYSGSGLFEDYTTADIYYDWTTSDNSGSFGNVSSSVSGGSITILTGGDGLYMLSRDHGIHGEENTNYTFGIFVNNTAISESTTSPSRGVEAEPFFANLSSFSDATYNTNSSLSFLEHNDKDQIKIIESSTGNGVNEWCFEYETHYLINHIPHVLIMGNVQYNGGAGHYADAVAYDNLSSEWDDLRLATGDIVNAGAQADYKNEHIAFEFPNSGLEDRYIDGSQVVKVRIRHNDSVVCNNGHEIWIDKLTVTDKLGPRSDSSSTLISLSAGDVVTLKEKPDTANKYYHRHKTRLTLVRVGN